MNATLEHLCARVWLFPREVLPPHRSFTDSLDLANGVRLSHVGGRHAEDSVVVEVPDSGVLPHPGDEVAALLAQ